MIIRIREVSNRTSHNVSSPSLSYKYARQGEHWRFGARILLSREKQFRHVSSVTWRPEGEECESEYSAALLLYVRTFTEMVNDANIIVSYPYNEPADLVCDKGM